MSNLHIAAVRMSKCLLEWADAQAKEEDLSRNAWICNTLEKVNDPRPNNVESLRYIDEASKQLISIKISRELLERLDAKIKDKEYLTRTRWIELCLLHELEKCNIVVRLSECLLEWTDAQAKEETLSRDAWICKTLKKIDNPSPESAENLKHVDEAEKRLVSLQIDERLIKKLNTKNVNKNRTKITRARWIELCLLHELEDC